MLKQNTSAFAELQAADFDGDGRTDIAYRSGVHAVSWAKNLGGQALADPTLVGVSASGAYVVADMDADGDPDIVTVRQNNGVCMLHENRTGGLQWTPRLLTDQFENAKELAAGDIDGDGDLDLIASSRVGLSVQRCLNLGPAGFGPVDVVANWPYYRRPVGFDLVDFDGDSQLDVVVTLTSGGHSEPEGISLLRGNGLGQFAPEEIIAELPYRQNSSPSAIGDADGDGDLDVLIATEGHFEIITTTGAGYEAPLPIYASSFATLSFDHSDLDGDGDTDLVLAQNGLRAISVWKNRGDGLGYDTTVVHDDLYRTRGAQVNDVDGDGDGDLVVLFEDPINVIVAGWLANDGNGSFGPVQRVYTQATISTDQDRMALGDMEGDGDLDWLLAHRSLVGAPGILIWLVNDGAGNFTVGPSLSTPLGVDVSLAAPDLDGDGDADVVTVDGSFSAGLHWRENMGAGALSPPRTLLPTSGGLWGVFFDAADMDEDGDVDLLATDGFRLFWFENLGGLQWLRRQDLQSNYQYIRQVRARDLDGDGDTDVLAAAYGTTSRWYENLGGATTWDERIIPSAQERTFDIEAIDLDGDLDLDFLKTSGSEEYIASLFVNINDERLGVAYCGTAIRNSSGKPGAISATGSADVTTNALSLLVQDLPTSTFGYFLLSDTPGFLAVPGGSQGNLCLTGAIGRLNRSSAEIFQTDNAGAATVDVDLMSLPGPTSSAPAVAGQSRYFQAWFRDANPTVASNFTNGLRIDFR